MNMKGTPWEPIPGTNSDKIPTVVGESSEAGADEEEDLEKVQAEGKEDEEMEDDVEEQEEHMRELVKMYIKKADIRKYGMTPCCEGCRGIEVGKTRVVHSEACRQRIKEEMNKDDKGRVRLGKEEERQNRWIQKVVERVEEMTQRTDKDDDHSDKRQAEERKSESSSSSTRGPTGANEGRKREAETETQENQSKKVRMSSDDSGKPDLKGGDKRDTDAEENRGEKGIRASSLERQLDRLMNDKETIKGKACMDLTGRNVAGEMWDFSQKEHRNEAMRAWAEEKPILIVGCSPFQRKLASQTWGMAEQDLDFGIKLYELQNSRGGFYLHGSPRVGPRHAKESAIGKHEFIKTDIRRLGVGKNNYSLNVIEYVATDVCTNFGAMGSVLLNLQATGDSRVVKRNRGGANVWLGSYSETNATNIVDALAKEIMLNERGLLQVGLIKEVVGGEVGQEDVPHDEDGGAESGKYQWAPEAWDDISGQPLEAESVRRARREEIQYVHDMQLYTKVPIDECVRVTGKQPIAARWVDVNKGDSKHPQIR